MTFRQIHTQIWKDDYFLDLAPEEKLLFIYLFSNDNTSLTGLYKIAMRVICFETGLDQNFVIDTLKKFEQAGKVVYESGLMWVINMRKYHETRSPKIKTAILNDLAGIPDCPLKKRYLSGNIPYTYPIHTDAYHTIPDSDTNHTTPEADSEGLPAGNFPEPAAWKDDPAIDPPAAAPTTPYIHPARKAESLLTKCGRMPAIPAKELPRVEQVLSMIQEYGERHVEDALTEAFRKWINTPRKNGGGNYSPLNFGWVDWAQEALMNVKANIIPTYSKNMKPDELNRYLEAMIAEKEKAQQ